MFKLIVKVAAVAAILATSACTTNQGVFTGGKGQKFDLENTIGAGIGITALVLLGGGGTGGSSYSVSYHGYQYDHDWDQLSNGQFRCRGVAGSAYAGQFVASSLCTGKLKVDQWY